jgi:hypothetical protein
MLLCIHKVKQVKKENEMENLNENQTRNPIDIECLFKGETYWGQDGNLYACVGYDYVPLAYVSKELIDGLNGDDWTDYIYTYKINIEEMLDD